MADMRSEDLIERVRKGTAIERADLRELDLRGAKLERAELRGSALDGANLEGASLGSAKLALALALLLADFARPGGDSRSRGHGGQADCGGSCCDHQALHNSLLTRFGAIPEVVRRICTRATERILMRSFIPRREWLPAWSGFTVR